jgi:preprotein translocase subunit SecG
METEALLEQERRLSRPAAGAALGGVVALIVSILLQASASKDAPGRNDPDRHRQSLLQFKAHAGTLLASTLVQALAAFLVAAALVYLYRASQQRRPETPSWILPLLVGAPVLLLVAGLITHFQVSDLADKFTSAGPRTDARAKHLLDGESPIGQAIGLAGALAAGLSLVLVSMNAMRAGLLSRFMGILGVIAGVLFVLPLLPGIPVVEIFWLAALAGLFLDYWPGGRGPAWDSGHAEPWPSAAELRAAATEEEPASAEEQTEPGAPSGRTRKRKRKRRR